MPIIGIIASSAPGFLNDYDSIDTVLVTSSTQAEIEFANIPSTYTHLQLRISYSMVSAGVVKMNFNSDTGANYKSQWLYGPGTGTPYSGTSSVNPNAINAGYSIAGSQLGSIVVDILDYANTSKHKQSRQLDGGDGNGNGSIEFSNGVWLNTNAITNIKFTGQFGNFQQHSKFALYGIKGA
jgi:hypothetical protein